MDLSGYGIGVGLSTQLGPLCYKSPEQRQFKYLKNGVPGPNLVDTLCQTNMKPEKEPFIDYLLFSRAPFVVPC